MKAQLTAAGCHKLDIIMNEIWFSALFYLIDKKSGSKCSLEVFSIYLSDKRDDVSENRHANRSVF